jgi:hypothetical protein
MKRINTANKQQKLVIPALKESPTPCRNDGQRTESKRDRSDVHPLHGMLPALFSASNA